MKFNFNRLLVGLVVLVRYSVTVSWAVARLPPQPVRNLAVVAIEVAVAVLQALTLTKGCRLRQYLVEGLAELLLLVPVATNGCLLRQYLVGGLPALLLGPIAVEVEKGENHPLCAVIAAVALRLLLHMRRGR